MLSWFKSKAPSIAKTSAEKVEEFDDPSEIYTFFSNLTGIHFDQKESIVTPKLIRFAREDGCSGFKQLYQKLDNDERCREKLINLLTVNETYFYREMGQIEFAVQCMNNDSVYRRILCAPGSSGEEPYSLAIYLAEHGCDLSTIEIVSIDINTEVIEKAKQGIYPERSLYRLNDEIKARYFECTEGGYRMIDSIRRRVSFYPCNVFDEAFEKLGKFDIVFSRNMLIYFDPETILRAVEQLKKVASSEKTIFFFGHADIVTKIPTLHEHYVGGIKYYTIQETKALCGD